MWIRIRNTDKMFKFLYCGSTNGAVPNFATVVLNLSVVKKPLS
jgi:hypothetical protein